MPGRRLGHYEILAPLGRGGMGEVFRAIDTHLEREVALKVLNDDLAGDDKLLARFDREAKLLAAVHHPNIAAIHSIEYADGRPFLVLELVRGQSLKSRLTSGPLPPSEAFEIARQIAEALAAAHARRVIHRDLKPANVMVTPEGVVKLLDFGVAKALEIDRSGAREGSAAVGSEAITTSGLILGTAPYMSPEQVRGKPLDARSDVWSFGCVLYEMLAGRPAFQRDTMGDTLAAIIDCEVDWSALPATTPQPIRRLLQRCLQTDPQRRLPDVAAVPRDLEAALQATSGATSALARALDHRAYRWGLAAVLVVVLAATFLLGGGWLGGSRAPAPAVDETTAIAVPLTALLGSEEAPSLSPDARFVAFAWNGGAGSVLDLYVQQIGSGDPLRLTDGSADIAAPTWSPDASELAFLRNEAGGWQIAAVPPLGGPQRLFGVVSAVTFPGLDYAPTGERLAVVHRPSAAAAEAIFLVERDSGEMTRLSEPERAGDGDRSPAFSPDGQSLAFVRWHELPRNDIYVTDLAGNDRLLISHDAFIEGLAWLSDGSGLLFSSARAGTTSSLWRVDLRGRAQPLDFGDSARAVTISRDSLVYTRRQQDTNLWIVGGPAAPEPVPPRRLIASTRDDWAPDFSPDGRRIAFASDRSGDARV
ncbi:MAG: protein kinase, partial [Acidobacteriota bacterium]